MHIIMQDYIKQRVRDLTGAVESLKIKPYD